MFRLHQFGRAGAIRSDVFEKDTLPFCRFHFYTHNLEAENILPVVPTRGRQCLLVIWKVSNPYFSVHNVQC